MSHVSPNYKGESVTFRIDPALKAELSRLAARHHTSLGGLLRDMARQRLALERRRTFVAEARRQSQQAAAAARDPGTDESAVMRELETDINAFGDEWS